MNNEFASGKFIISIYCDRLRDEIFIAEQTSLTERLKLNSLVIKFTSDKEEGELSSV